MDELYNNAWGESVQLDTEETTTTTRTTIISSLNLKPSSWLQSGSSSVAPPQTVQDDEADLAAPSWSTGADMRWDEPSEDAHGFGWSQTEPDMAWGTSTYDSIHIGKASKTPEVNSIDETDDVELAIASPPPSTTTSEHEAEADEESEETSEDAGYTSLYHAPEEAEPDTPSSFIERSPSPDDPESPLRTPVPAILPSRSPSPDGFGRFSSGFEAEDAGGFKTEVGGGDLEDDAWGSAWTHAAGEESTQEEEEVEDEWTAARKRKEILDRTIPPEVMDEIKKRCEELGVELTPKVDPKLVDFDKDSFRNNLRATMEDLDGIEAVKHEYLPELTLQPPLKFSKTAVAKGMNNAIRLTRNLPMVKDSPMSHYLASKGSTAWETSVKGRKEIVEEDVVPIGWRILEKEQPKPTAAPTQRTTGRLFSFWGRKDSKPTNTPLAAAAAVSGHRASISDGATKSSPVESISRSSHDRRDSTDSTRSASLARKASNSSAIHSSSPAVPPEIPVPVTTSSPAPPSDTAPPVPLVPAPTTSYADAPLADLDGTEAPPGAAPSAVSRFLGRFSRRRSAIPSSPRQSLALSSDDLEFLSDIVPSMNDETDNQKAMAAMLTPEPIPPILAPPPQVPQPTPTSSKSVPTPTSTPALLGPSKTLPPQPQTSQLTMNGFDSFFDALEAPTLSNVSRTTSQFSMGISPILSPLAPASSSRPQSPASFSQAAQRDSKPPTPSRLPAQLFAPPPPPAPRSQTPILTRQESTPLHLFTLPPPPSSRSQTPVSLSPPSRPQSELSQVNKMPSPAHARPKIPPGQIGIPPPLPSLSSPLSASTSSLSPVSQQSISRAPTPTSSVPLAVLYPNAVAARSLSSPPSFTLSPPSASRGHTPLPPPPSSNTLQPVFPPSKSSTLKPVSPPIIAPFDEEDDFADFQSSKPTPLTPDSSFLSPSFQSPTSAMQAPMLAGPPNPGSFGARRALPKPSASAFFKSAAATKPLPLSFDSFDDEFSAFASSSTPPLQTGSSRNLGFDTSGSSLLPTSRSGFDDFNSFSSSSPGLRTPSPPRPPAKNPPMMAASPPKRKLESRPTLTIAPPPPPPSSSPDASRANRHQHTLSLLQMANSKKGQRWPAPASPLPQALFPPPQAPGKSSAAFDLMGEDDSFGSFNLTTSEGLLASTSSPATFGQPLLPSGLNGLKPVPQSQSLQTVSSTGSGSGRWLMGSTETSSGSLQSIASSSVIGKSKAGGALSAQDLSFFEGL